MPVDTTPRWFDESFGEFVEYAGWLRDVCFTAVAGFRRIIEYPYPSGRMLRVFKEDLGYSPTELGQKYAEQYRIALEEERERQYIILYRVFTVTAWDSLEYFINDFLADWLQHEPSSRTLPAVARAAARNDVQGLASQRERDYLTVKYLPRSLPRPSAPALGVDMFERILEPFGLSGPVDTQTRELLLSLHQIRNALVHQRGTVDERLARDFPFLGLNVGDRIKLTEDHFSRSARATLEYARILLQRVAQHYGIVR